MKLTKKQILKCEQISNDISEDIDNNDSPVELRRAVFYYAELAGKEAGKRAALEGDMMLVKIAQSYLEIALLKEPKPKQRKKSKQEVYTPPNRDNW